MKKLFLHIGFMMAILCLSVPLFAQGVPKAYEAIKYQGKLNGSTVKFSLANGYIGASSLSLFMPGKLKPLMFQPDAGVADEHNRLKFVPGAQNGSGYFIMDNMQETYDNSPVFISGKYYLKGKMITVKLWQVKTKRLN
jgi:hypothetical protein